MAGTVTCKACGYKWTIGDVTYVAGCPSCGSFARDIRAAVSALAATRAANYAEGHRDGHCDRLLNWRSIIALTSEIPGYAEGYAKGLND